MCVKEIPRALVAILIPITFFKTNNSKEEESDQCELIGTFSLLTQAVLGLLCLSSLIVKRFYEHPIRRTWPVWLFDVLKQLIGAFGVHIFNIFLSILKTRKTSNELEIKEDELDSSNDPCDWYFLNIVLDCTIGVYILYLVFKALTKYCQNKLQITQIESGKYGDNPNKPSSIAFLKQLGIYFASLMITKFILYGIVECYETQLLWFTSHVILVWLDEYPDEFEIFIVMFVVPIVMNCLQLILIDNFIQNQWLQKTRNQERLEEEEEETGSEANISNETDRLVSCEAQYKGDEIESQGGTVQGDKIADSYGTFENA